MGVRSGITEGQKGEVQKQEETGAGSSGQYRLTRSYIKPSQCPSTNWQRGSPEVASSTEIIPHRCGKHRDKDESQINTSKQILGKRKRKYRLTEQLRVKAKKKDQILPDSQDSDQIHEMGNLSRSCNSYFAYSYSIGTEQPQINKHFCNPLSKMFL